MLTHRHICSQTHKQAIHTAKSRPYTLTPRDTHSNTHCHMQIYSCTDTNVRHTFICNAQTPHPQTHPSTHTRSLCSCPSEGRGPGGPRESEASCQALCSPTQATRVRPDGDDRTLGPSAPTPTARLGFSPTHQQPLSPRYVPATTSNTHTHSLALFLSSTWNVVSPGLSSLPHCLTVTQSCSVSSLSPSHPRHSPVSSPWPPPQLRSLSHAQIHTAPCRHTVSVCLSPAHPEQLERWQVGEGVRPDGSCYS